MSLPAEPEVTMNRKHFRQINNLEAQLRQKFHIVSISVLHKSVTNQLGRSDRGYFKNAIGEGDVYCVVHDQTFDTYSDIPRGSRPNRPDSPPHHHRRTLWGCIACSHTGTVSQNTIFLKIKRKRSTIYSYIVALFDISFLFTSIKLILFSFYLLLLRLGNTIANFYL